MSYRLNGTRTVFRIADKTYIPFDPANMDYQAYLIWLSEGNTPLPYESSEGNTPLPADEPNI